MTRWCAEGGRSRDKRLGASFIALLAAIAGLACLFAGCGPAATPREAPRAAIRSPAPLAPVPPSAPSAPAKATPPGPRPILAIVEFAVAKSYKGTLSGKEVAALLVSRFQSDGRYELAARFDVEGAIKELKLSRSDLNDPHYALKLGRRISAAYVVCGRVFQIGRRRTVCAQMIHVERLGIVGAGQVWAYDDEGLTDRLGHLARLLQKRGAAAQPVSPFPRWQSVRETVMVATPERRRKRTLVFHKNPLGMRFVEVSPEALDTAGGWVRLPAFWIGATEVTNGEYHLFMERSRYRGEADCGPDYLNHFQHGRPAHGRREHPVRWVAWDNARAFCKWLTGQGKEARYRLPTESEWECAYRAGSRTTFYWGDSVHGSCAWYFANSRGTAHRVGRKWANAYGLFDMAGNVWEWCRPSEAGDASRVRACPIRGGSFNDEARDLQATRGKMQNRRDATAYAGFRVVAVPATPTGNPD